MDSLTLRKHIRVFAIAGLLRGHPLQRRTFVCGGDGNLKIGGLCLSWNIDGQRTTIGLGSLGQIPLDLFTSELDVLDV